MINFPDSPILNQVFTSGGRSWKWDGARWTVLTAASHLQPFDLDLSAIADLTTTPFGRSLLTVADAPAGRVALGAEVSGAAAAAQAASQPLDPDLTAIAALSTTPFGRSLLTTADAAASRASLGAMAQARTQVAASETLWTFTTNQPATPLSYSSGVVTQTFAGVTETNMAIGYGTFGGGGASTGHLSGFLTWLPNCGDTESLQWQFQGVFPNGAAYKGFEFQASNKGNNATRWNFNFHRGSDFAGYFVVNDGTSPYIIATTASTVAGSGNVQLPQKSLIVGQSSTDGVWATLAPTAGLASLTLTGVGGNSAAGILATSAGNGGATFGLDASTGSGGAVITMSSASTGPNSVHFKRAGAFTWSIYDAGSAVLYIRDQTNGVMTMQFVAGAGTSGAVNVNASLRVNGNVGFFNTAPAAKPTVTGAKGSNAALGSLVAALVALGLVTDSTSA